MQTTNTVMMVRPVRFGFNVQTAESNAFQDASAICDANETQQKALEEFDNFVKKLGDNGINVIVINDTPEPHTPDSIFPNNWISFHNDGTVVLYPMQAENRRLERRRSILDFVGQEYEWNKEIDLSHYEIEEKFLEGTGSMVLDREHRLCYACISPRTNHDVLNDFSKKLGYKIVDFIATDATDKQIYHTNVVMCLGEKYAVICLDTIRDKAEKEKVEKALRDSGKAIVDITMDQLYKFAGNMLELKNDQGESLLVMSEQAFKALNPAQVTQLENYSKILHSPLYTIETNGGGSARCMLAEVHLPVKRK